jgi:23S rRNA (cytidine1920-2'-O)/16S rRNA (cytidine1409-2'-O)-methyltransferase
VAAPKKLRADRLVVERGLAESRERARALILAGKVFSGERRIEKAGDDVPIDSPLEVRGEALPFVSRGGVKLAGALDDLGLDPKDLVAADIGASTGGFTDCLLSRGARRVYAVDVGYGQLHQKLRSDPRVVVMERTNARYLERDHFPERIDLVVVDASFIGLEKLLPAIQRVLSPRAPLLALVKPQFEVGRERVGKGGVVRDAEARESAIAGVVNAGTALGFLLRGRADSKLKGPSGNQETFVWLDAPAGGKDGGPNP